MKIKKIKQKEKNITALLISKSRYHQKRDKIEKKKTKKIQKKNTSFSFLTYI